MESRASLLRTQQKTGPAGEKANACCSGRAVCGGVRRPQRKGQTAPICDGIPCRPELHGANQADKLFGGDESRGEKTGDLEKEKPQSYRRLRRCHDPKPWVKDQPVVFDLLRMVAILGFSSNRGYIPIRNNVRCANKKNPRVSSFWSQEAGVVLAERLCAEPRVIKQLYIKSKYGVA